MPRPDDFAVPYSLTNTLTLIHSHNQANLALLNNYGYDSTSRDRPPEHPLTSHLLPLNWLQLLRPALCNTYASAPPESTPEEVASWKPARRGHYHRKRRRWARTRHIVDTARKGGFSGLVVASQMDPVSILRHTLPLLAGGAPVAVYSPTVEPRPSWPTASASAGAAWAGSGRPASAEGRRSRSSSTGRAATSSPSTRRYCSARPCRRAARGSGRCCPADAPAHDRPGRRRGLRVHGVAGEAGRGEDRGAGQVQTAEGRRHCRRGVTLRFA